MERDEFAWKSTNGSTCYVVRGVCIMTGRYKILCRVRDESTGRILGVKVRDNYGTANNVIDIPTGKYTLLKGSCTNGTVLSDNRISADVPTVMNKKTNIITVYHGSYAEHFVPTYGKGEDKHDYGRGFYTTPNIELGKEWACSFGNCTEGWLHTYELDLTGLKIYNFEQLPESTRIYAWLAELLKHRDGGTSKRYKAQAARFIAQYGLNLDAYDVIFGYRADSSYFYIAKFFMRDELDCSLLEEALKIGDLGIQCFIKSQRAFKQLKEVHVEPVDYAIYAQKYNKRDSDARTKLYELQASERNTLTYTVSKLLDANTN